MVSATARLVRNLEVVLESSVLRMTIRLMTFPKIPVMIMAGHTTPYIAILATTTVYTSVSCTGEDERFSALKVVMLSTGLAVV